MIKSVNDKPCSGWDVSRYQGAPNIFNGVGDAWTAQNKPSWLQFYGMKTSDVGGSAVGIDPCFKKNRALASQMDIRWRGLYFYARSDKPVAANMELFSYAVGNLQSGEFVFLDWEDAGITLVMVEQYLELLEVCYPGRWAVYVGDNTTEKKDWITTRRVPLIYPNWSPTGWARAQQYGAAIWQTGIAPTGTFDFFFPGKEVDVDFVRQPYVLDRITGR